MRIAKMVSVWVFGLLIGGLLGSPSWALFGMGSKSDQASKSDQSSSMQSSESKSKASLGQAAPDFSLKDAQGNSHSLADFKGKSVVLIWTNPDCPYVQRHDREGTFQGMTQKYDRNKVQFIEIVSHQAGANAGATSTAKSDNILTLYDPQGTVTREYRARRTPEAFVINPSGNLSYKGAVDNDPKGKMSASERKNYVDEALSAVTSGQTPKDQHTRAYGCPIKGEHRMWGPHRKGSAESTNQPTEPAQPGSSSPPASQQ